MALTPRQEREAMQLIRLVLHRGVNLYQGLERINEAANRPAIQADVRALLATFAPLQDWNALRDAVLAFGDALKVKIDEYDGEGL